MEHEEKASKVIFGIFCAFIIVLGILVLLNQTGLPTGNTVKGIEIGGEVSMSIATAIMGMAIVILVFGIFTYTLSHYKRKR